MDRRKLKKQILKSIKIHIVNWNLIGIDYDAIPPLILAIKERALVYRNLDLFSNSTKYDDYCDYVKLKYEYEVFNTVNYWENDLDSIIDTYSIKPIVKYPFYDWSVSRLKKICRKF